MHDGRFASLTAVLDHYSSLAQAAPCRSASATRAVLRAERSALLAFLDSLTDETFVGRAR